LGGKGIAAYCNHEDPQEVKQLFERIAKEQNSRLDILVNNAYAAVQYIGKNVTRKFFDYEGAPEQAWDVVNNVGLRNHYICSVYASRLMVPRKQGLIVTLSSPGNLLIKLLLPFV
jgi:dehydrogenase/reductase SDR family protein 1